LENSRCIEVKIIAGKVTLTNKEESPLVVCLSRTPSLAETNPTKIIRKSLTTERNIAVINKSQIIC